MMERDLSALRDDIVGLLERTDDITTLATLPASQRANLVRFCGAEGELQDGRLLMLSYAEHEVGTKVVAAAIKTTPRMIEVVLRIAWINEHTPLLAEIMPGAWLDEVTALLREDRPWT